MRKNKGKRDANPDEKLRVEKAANKLDAILEFLSEGFTAEFVARKLTDMSETKLSKLRNLNTSNHNSVTREAASIEIIKIFGLKITETKPAEGQSNFDIEFEKGHSFQSFNIHYDYFYTSYSNQVCKGLLTISPGNKKAELKFYDVKGENLILRTKYLDGEIIDLKENNKFSILFKKRLQVYNKHESIKPLFVTFEGDYEDIFTPFKLGAYAVSESISSGMALLKYNPASGLKDNTAFIPENIIRFLLDSRLNADIISKKALEQLHKNEPLRDESPFSIPNRIITLRSTDPVSPNLAEFSSGLINSYPNEEGLILLAERINSAQWVFNTRIIPEDSDTYYTPRASVWRESITKNLKRGMIFKEILSGFWVNESIELKKLFPEQYRARKITMPFKSMLNITIIGFNGGAEELWFGWAISSVKGLEHPCFHITDSKTVDFFKDWYYDIFESGQEITFNVTKVQKGKT